MLCDTQPLVDEATFQARGGVPANAAGCYWPTKPMTPKPASLLRLLSDAAGDSAAQHEAQPQPGLADIV